jgi:hypothetical protein
MGENSPNNIIITYGVLQYIQAHSKDIGEILTIELRLEDSFAVEVSRRSRLYRPISGFENLEGRYIIKTEQIKKCSYKEFLNRESNFVSTNDLAKEKEEKYELFSNATDFKKDLKLNIMRDKKIYKYDIFYSSDVIYDKTYKLELIIFNKKILSLTNEEIKLEYYKWYLPIEFEKLKFELEKYFTKKHYQTHIEILRYYEKKFISRKNEQSDPNHKKCYELITIEIKNLVEHLKEYFGIIERKSQIPKKLQWNTSYKKFIDFFELLIDEEEIQYKGKKDKCAIYYNLLDKIEVKNNGMVSINSIMKDLGFVINKDLEKIEICKLDYTKSMTTFAWKFSKLIYISDPKESTLLLNGKSSRDPIVKKLFNLFSIRSEFIPYNEIDVNSLIVTFKKVQLE